MREYIQPPQEWIDDARDWIIESKKQVAKRIFEKYGGEVPLPVFFHMDLCDSLETIYFMAPSEKEAKDMVKECMKFVIDKFKKEKLGVYASEKYENGTI